MKHNDKQLNFDGYSVFGDYNNEVDINEELIDLELKEACRKKIMTIRATPKVINYNGVGYII